MRLLAPCLVALSACLQIPDSPDDGDDGDGGDDGDLALDAAAYGAQRWPAPVVNYYVDDGSTDITSYLAAQPHCKKTLGPLDAQTVSNVKPAIDAYNTQTPIPFHKLDHVPTPLDGPVLVITRGATSNWAGGPPGNDPTDFIGCTYIRPGRPPGTIEHEVAHAMGLPHEQERSDYCHSINIDLTDVPADDQSQFDTRPTSLNLTPYDVHSLMHYHNTQFCTKDPVTHKCEHPTLMPLGCTDAAACPIGSNGLMTADDINAFYRMYEPHLGGNEPDDHFGWAMASGDFDGDGYDDLAVGVTHEAVGTGAPTSGAVMLYKGTEGGLVAWRLLQEADFASATPGAGDQFGIALAVGDFDGDGYADLLVGAPGYGTGGSAFLYQGHGADNDRIGMTAWAMYADRSPSTGANRFGAAVAMHGSTLAIGAPNAASHTVRNGMVFVHIHDGSWTAMSQDNGGIYTLPAGTNYGASVALGDLQSTNSQDLAVGAPGDGSTLAGQVFLYTRALAFNRVIAAAKPAAGDQFGAALTLGHYYTYAKNGLAVGAPGAATGGRVDLFDVGTNTVTRFVSLSQADVPGMGAAAGDRFGASLASGNLDADQFDDVAVGVPGNSSGQGIVALLRGNGGSGLVGWTFINEASDGRAITAGDSFGNAVAIGRFGDLNNDPFDRNDVPADLAIGAPHRTINSANDTGTVQEFLGVAGGKPKFIDSYDQFSTHVIRPIPPPHGACKVLVPPA